MGCYSRKLKQFVKRYWGLFPLCSEEGLYSKGVLLVTASLYCHVTGIAWAGPVPDAVFPQEEKLRRGKVC